MPQCLPAKCMPTRSRPTSRSCAGCSPRSFRSGQTFPSSRSIPPGRTTRSIGSATDMAVRLPRIHWAIGQVDKEHRWLPEAGPAPAACHPCPAREGDARRGLPLALVRLPVARRRERDHRAHRRSTPGGDGPGAIRRRPAADRSHGRAAPGTAQLFRGVPLATRDARTRAAIAALDGMLDTDAVTAAWEAALQAPAWHGPPVWIHGDLQSGNLLAVAGRLSAVIDFGCLGVGDPACDLIVAWNALLRRNPGRHSAPRCRSTTRPGREAAAGRCPSG